MESDKLVQKQFEFLKFLSFFGYKIWVVAILD